MAVRAEVESKRPIDLILNLIGRLGGELPNDLPHLRAVVALQILLGELQLAGGRERLDPHNEMVGAVMGQVRSTTVAAISNHEWTNPFNSFVRSLAPLGKPRAPSYA